MKMISSSRPMVSYLSAVWLAVAVVFSSGMALAAEGDKKEITIKGSDTLLILANRWATAYMAKNADVKIMVNGGGSGVGFTALADKSIDITDASRAIKADEMEKCIKAFKAVPKEYIVAVDGLSVFVNNDNPVHELDMAQLKDIFTGKITNWKDVGGADAPISVYSRENSSGTYEYFKEHVLKKADFAASVQTMQGTAQLLTAISNDHNGIGYGGAAYGGSARAIAVKKDASTPGVLPTEENVLNKSYPIWRYLYNYVNPAVDKGAVHAYLNWIRGDAGQALVKEVGYYPLPQDKRSK